MSAGTFASAFLMAADATVIDGFTTLATNTPVTDAMNPFGVAFTGLC
jgi:hypothetical protein